MSVDDSRTARRRVVDRSDRGFVVVDGPDAFSFLQSLVSAGPRPASPTARRVHSLLLTPQGKLDVEFRLAARRRRAAWLDCDAGFGAQLAASLDRFRIRVKAEVDDRSRRRGVGALASRSVATWRCRARRPTHALDG